MRLQKRFAALLLALLLLCALSATAYAHEVPDTSRKGSVSVTMTYEGDPVPGGTLTLYRVGVVAEEDGNYSFVLTGDFTGSNADLTDISSKDLAEGLKQYAEDRGLTGTPEEIGADGKAAFSNLELGLYLLVQTEAADGYEAVVPFLVTVPMKEDGVYLYDVEASPKAELKRELEPIPAPPSPPTPTGPTLPQTGQLNWPIPVLTVSGLCLFAVGWAVRFGPKRNRYEG